MKESHRIFIIIILFLTFVFFLFNYTNKSAKEQITKLSNEYQYCELSDAYNNIVSRTYFPDNIRGEGYTQYITFENDKKVCIGIRTGITSKSILFGDIIKTGALIKKNSYSDTLIVIVNRKVFKFLIYIDNE